MWCIWRIRKVGEYLREETLVGTLTDVLLRSIQERTKAMIPSSPFFNFLDMLNLELNLFMYNWVYSCLHPTC